MHKYLDGVQYGPLWSVTNSLWSVYGLYFGVTPITKLLHFWSPVPYSSCFHSPFYILIKNYWPGLYFLAEKRNKVQLPAGGIFLPAKRNKSLEKKNTGWGPYKKNQKHPLGWIFLKSV